MDKSIDHHHVESIDNSKEEPIDNNSAHWKNDYLDGNFSTDSWENDRYHPTFVVDTAMAEIRYEEYAEDYKEERATEYHGLLTEENIVLHPSY